MNLYKTCRFLVGKTLKVAGLTFLFFIVSCSQSRNEKGGVSGSQLVSIEERAWMEKFFQEFFLGNSSLYTLFGTKPISAETLTYATEEDYRKNVLLYMEKEGIQNKAEMLENALKSFQEDDFQANWMKWLVFIAKFPKSPFLFATHPTLSDKIFSAHILNIQQTIWTLQNHYEIFKNEIGYDFDPISVTMDFTNEDSPFWKAVFSNHLLTGIVYGFGYKNSYFFAERMKLGVNNEVESPIFSSVIAETCQEDFTYSLKGLRLPSFRSFETLFNDDPVLEKYKLERNKIRGKLNDSNFFDMVFLQLTGGLVESI